jgi:uncharacterized membrane protein
VIDFYGIIVGVACLLPLLLFSFKERFIYFATAAIIAIGLHGTYLFGPHILYLLLITYIVSTVIELVALKTSVRCFGVKYWYNLNRFSSQIHFLNVYPLEVSLGWVILKYLSFCLAIIIIQAFLLPHVLVIFLTPFILVSLDFIIDPIAVNINKSWQWEKGSKYFGIPLRDFLGWYTVGFLTTLIFALLVSERKVEFNLLYLLPIVFYGAFIKNSIVMFKLDKKMAIIGTIPAVTWTLLALAGLVILLLQGT